jgi:predicted RNA-binding protein with PUA-like domain
MNYWLVKSEPFKYSWDDFVKEKSKGWGTNYQARNNMMAMKKAIGLFTIQMKEWRS